MIESKEMTRYTLMATLVTTSGKRLVIIDSSLSREEVEKKREVFLKSRTADKSLWELDESGEIKTQIEESPVIK